LFYGQNPEDVEFIVANKSNANQGLADFHQILRITTNPIYLTKQEFGQLGVGPRLELADLNDSGILYIKYNNKVLSTFEIANFTYDIIQKVEAIQDLDAAALSMATDIPIPFVLDKVMISFNANVTETVVTYYVTSDGTEIPIDTQALVAVPVYTYFANILVDDGDQIKVTCTDNMGGAIATAYIFVQRRWDGQ